jgi:hypothetical protein
MMRKLWTALLLSGLMIWMISCKEDEPMDHPPATITLELLDGPTALLANADTMYTYRVRLASGTADRIECRIMSPSGAQDSVFNLYDDGNSLVLTAPSYASATSGDLVAGNGIFTRRINGRLLTGGITGWYTFIFSGVGQAQSEPESLRVDLENVLQCTIASVPPDQSFKKCFPPQTLSLTVIPDSVDHLDSVTVTLMDGDTIKNVAGFFPSSDDTVFSMTVTPEFFRCTGTGSNYRSNYTLRYDARTRFGFTCWQEVTNVSFINDLPVLSDPTGPDTIWRPTDPTVVDSSVFTVRVHDCDGLYPLFGRVRFDVSVDDTIHWSDWSQNQNFYLRDDGLAGDADSADGRYSVTLTIDTSLAFHNNEYYFRFYAVECAPPYEFSAYVYDSIRVIERGAGPFLTNAGRKEQEVLGIVKP